MDDTGRRGGRRGDPPRPQQRRTGSQQPPDWPVNEAARDTNTPEGSSGFEGGWFGKPASLDDRPRTAYRPNGQSNGQANGHRINGMSQGGRNARTNGSVNGSVNGARNGAVNGAVNGSVNGAPNGTRPGMPPVPSHQWPPPRDFATQPPRPPVPRPAVPTRYIDPPTEPVPIAPVTKKTKRDEYYDKLYKSLDGYVPEEKPEVVEDEAEEENPLEGFHTKDEKKRKRKLPFWVELPVLVVVALLFTFVIQSFVARVYVIPSGSMEQTLLGNNGTGDRILVDKVVYDFRSPSPGDVIVFKGPPGWDQTEFFPDTTSNPVIGWLRDLAADIGVAKPNEYDLVKRVIAVGGQTVSCCDAENRTMVDGKPLNEPYIYWQPGRPPPDQQLHYGPIAIPKGYVWVEGDNRNNSDDSRYQNGGGIHGIVPLSDVIGKARTIIWPPSRWRGIGDNNPQTVADGRLSWPDQLSTTGVGALATLPTLWLGRRSLIFGRTERLNRRRRLRRRSRPDRGKAAGP